MKQKEIWLINLDPTIGAEIAKTRPCVVLSFSESALPLKIVAPVTGWNEQFAGSLWHVRLFPGKSNNLDKASAIDMFQVRAISTSRFVRQIGTISDDDLEKCKKAVLAVFDI